MIRKASLATALTAACLLTFAAHAAATTDTFNYTGAAEEWAVPANVTSATFDLYGAQGGGGAYASVFGGLGGRATATIAVTPGTVFEVRVGGVGANYASGTTGGFNGGGDGGAGGGGGASDIRFESSGLAQRILVAGGGGAGGACNGTPKPHGGAGGGLQGAAAIDGGCAAGFVVGGGGTQLSGGSATAPAIAGSFGLGGTGRLTSPPAGGGGGGWFGGGGGTNNAGGGGGSGYGPLGTTFETGVRSDNGLATITYTVNLPAPTAPAGPTGQRAAALKKCKKYSKGTPRRKKCIKKAQKKPV